MIDLKIELIGDTELRAKFQTLPDDIQEAVYDKLNWLTNILYESVIENLSGKVLEPRSGELRASIQQETSQNGKTVSGWVGPIPATAKAWVQEYGGNSEYPIVPTKANILHFIASDGAEVFATRVSHPPLKERSYLRSALEDMPYLVYSAFLDAIDTAFAK